MEILLVGVKPVSTNDMYMPVATRGKGGKYYGRIVATSKLREFKAEIKKALDEVIKDKEPLDPKKFYKLYIEVSFPRREFMTESFDLKNCDASNTIKALEDGIYEALQVNDTQNMEVLVKKFYNEDETYVIYGKVEVVEKSVEDFKKNLEDFGKMMNLIK